MTANLMKILELHYPMIQFLNNELLAIYHLISNALSWNNC